MKLIWKETRVAVVATLVFAVVLCGVYPLIVWAGAQLLFPHQANGSLIEGKDGCPIGSSLLGQNFAAPKYFHPRSSAAGSNGYDATNSGGTNLGPTSQKLIDSVKERVAAYRAENHLAPDALAPADAVTSSASGLDPHISLKNAQLQAPRVAKQRGLRAETVRALIEQNTARRQLGILGEPGVNVLTLNLALDRATAP
jgi:K+-transporting ATPase ATPase C chain